MFFSSAEWICVCIARHISFVLHTFQRAVINLNDLLTERRSETKTKNVKKMKMIIKNNEI